MPKIQAYQCPKTNKIFTEREEYGIHLLDQRAIHSRKIRSQKIANGFLYKLHEAQATITSVEGIRCWMYDNIEDLLMYQYHNKTRYDRTTYEEYRGDYELLLFGLEAVPIKRKHNTAKGSCLEGYVTLSYSGNTDDFPAAHFNIPGIYVGGGGGTSELSRYGLVIHLNEWPGIADKMGSETMEDIIAGRDDRHAPTTKNFMS